MEEPEQFSFKRDLNKMLVDFKILRQYHPLAEIQYELLKNKKKDYIQETTFPICIQSMDTESTILYLTNLRSTVKDLMKRKHKALTFIDIGNMLCIISLYTKLQNPTQIKSFTAYNDDFERIVSVLVSIESNMLTTKDLYFQINHKGKNISNFGKSIEIREEDFIEDVLVMLKSKYINKLINLREDYLAHTEDIFYSPIEMYMEIAIAVALSKPVLRPYIITYKHGERLLRKKRKLKTGYIHDEKFLSMLYKTLIEYLTNETKTKEELSNSFSENCRIVNILCSACGLIEKTADEKKQYSSVRDVVKNFKSDERFKLSSLKLPGSLAD